MAFTTINDVRYHFEISGSGPILVLLHGFTGSVDNWTPLIEGLHASFSVLTVDLIGHGQTDSPADAQRYRMEYAAADLIHLLKEVIGEPCHLLGYSMGGRLALYSAIHYPDRFESVILESASPGLATEIEGSERSQHDNELADRIEQDGIEAFVDYWERIPLFASQQRLAPDIRSTLRMQRLRNRPSGLANSLRGMGTGTQPSLWDRLYELTRPTLLLAGALDTKFVGLAQQMYDLLPYVQLHIIPDAGHTLHLEATTPYWDVLIRFLSMHRRS